MKILDEKPTLWSEPRGRREHEDKKCPRGGRKMSCAPPTVCCWGGGAFSKEITHYSTLDTEGGNIITWFLVNATPNIQLHNNLFIRIIPGVQDQT